MEPSGDLAEWLRGLSDEELAALLQRRPDLAVGTHGDFEALAARVASRGSVAAALDGCDAFTLAVTAGLALANPGAPAGRLLTPPGPPATRLGELAEVRVPGACIQRAYDLLVSLALAAGPAQTPRLLRATAALVGGAPLGLGRAAAACLADAPPAQRAELAQRLGADPLTQLAHLDAGRLASLPADERAVLRDVDRGGGVGALQAARGPLPQPDDPSPARRLQARGFLVAVAPDLVELPREVGLALRGAHPLGRLRPDAPALGATEGAGTPGRRDVAEAAAAQAREVVRVVEALLERLSAHPAPVLKTGALGQREHRALTRALGLAEPAVTVLVEVAHAARLLASTTGQPAVWVPSERYDAWRELSVARRWAELAEAWLGMRRRPGGAGEPGDRGHHPGPLAPELANPTAAAVRRQALDLLASCRPETVGDPAAVADRIAWAAPRRTSRRTARYVREAFEEAELLGITVGRVLAPPGRALLAADSAAASTAAADSAAAVLTRLLPSPTSQVLLQADLTAVAPGVLTTELASELALAADLESAGGADVFRFSPASLRRALDAGRSGADLLSWLERIAQTEVPQPLAYLVADVARRHGVARVGAAESYLRCDDPALVAEILANRATRGLRLRALAPTVLVSTAPATAVLQGLRDAGFAPTQESADGTLVTTRVPGPRAATRPPVGRHKPPVPTRAGVGDIVRALREADRFRPSPSSGPGAEKVARTPADVLAALRAALSDGVPVLLGLLTPTGSVRSAVLVPSELRGGALTGQTPAGGLETVGLHTIVSAVRLERAARLDRARRLGAPRSPRSAGQPDGLAQPTPAGLGERAGLRERAGLGERA